MNYVGKLVTPIYARAPASFGEKVIWTRLGSLYLVLKEEKADFAISQDWIYILRHKDMLVYKAQKDFYQIIDSKEKLEFMKNSFKLNNI